MVSCGSMFWAVRAFFVATPRPNVPRHPVDLLKETLLGPGPGIDPEAGHVDSSYSGRIGLWSDMLTN